MLDAREHVKFDDKFIRFLDATERLFEALAVKNNRTLLEDRFVRELLLLKLSEGE